MTNVFDTMMKFEETQFPNFFKSTNATKNCFVEHVACVGWVGSFGESGLYVQTHSRVYVCLHVKSPHFQSVEEDAVTLEGDEEVFTCATDAVKWLETQVPFKIVG
jgi:hypothetical protein